MFDFDVFAILLGFEALEDKDAEEIAPGEGAAAQLFLERIPGAVVGGLEGFRIDGVFLHPLPMRRRRDVGDLGSPGQSADRGIGREKGALLKVDEVAKKKFRLF